MPCKNAVSLARNNTVTRSKERAKPDVSQITSVLLNCPPADRNSNRAKMGCLNHFAFAKITKSLIGANFRQIFIFTLEQKVANLVLFPFFLSINFFVWPLFCWKDDLLEMMTSVWQLINYDGLVKMENKICLKHLFMKQNFLCTI